jgi:gas vesicle protein
MAERSGDLLKGLIIGGFVGVVFGILYAPKSGKETREEIANKTDELLVKAKEEYGNALAKSKIVYEAAVKRLKEADAAAREKVEEMEEKVSQFAQQGSEKITENTNRIKKALDSGIEAYREEKNKKPA